ncbi:hypothetical protein FRB94_003444 [Tulasnella sp. JGI-2019a]|nr:hypothetical protein FRB93_005308 [Tulasnella sp. JGI-2019a]KAG9002973.1 hypothetical protein FRB94_003444 [Tulasnella sp. JGI-2019a]KAG9032332.1 hypothetical protein FRB95_001585 [Tulasnella sp. JGI-2019a]
MALVIGFLLSLSFLLFNVQATDLSTVKLNQVYWNDSRVSYSSPRASLSNVGWEAYNTTACREPSAFGTYLCNTGAVNLCSSDDTASLVFNGTSVTVNFLARNTGLSDIIVLVDGVQWTTVNTSSLNAEPFSGTTQLPTNCVGTSVTKSDLTTGVHNVTVVIPETDPQYAYTSLLQSFEYTVIIAATASTSGGGSKISLGAVIGRVLIGLFAILNITLLVWLYGRRRRNSQSRSVVIPSSDDFDHKHSDHRTSQYSEQPSSYLPMVGKISCSHSASRSPSKNDLHRTSTLETLEPLNIGSLLSPIDGGESSRLVVLEGPLDKGVPGPEIATVIQRMQEEASSAPSSRSPAERGGT